MRMIALALMLLVFLSACENRKIEFWTPSDPTGSVDGDNDPDLFGENDQSADTDASGPLTAGGDMNAVDGGTNDAGETDDPECACERPEHGLGTGHCKENHVENSDGHGNGHCKFDCE